MNLQIRAALLWGMIVFCYLVHGYYHISGLFFGIDIKMPDATGQMPLSMHFFSLLLEILPLGLAVASLYAKKKWFNWTNFILAILFLLLNVFHLGETIMQEADDIRQLALLSLVVIINLLLVMDTNQLKKTVTIYPKNQIA
jgi:hypothetical protein